MVTTKKHPPLSASHVVSCIGHLPSDQHQDLLGKEGYFPSPYEAGLMREFLPEENNIHQLLAIIKIKN